MTIVWSAYPLDVVIVWGPAAMVAAAIVAALVVSFLGILREVERPHRDRGAVARRQPKVGSRESQRPSLAMIAASHPWPPAR